MQGASFCHNCGARLGPSPQSSYDFSSLNNPYSQNSPPSAQRGAVDSAWRSSPMPTSPQRRIMGTNAVIAIVVAIFLALVMVGAAASQGWIHLNLGGSNDNQNHNPISTVGNSTITFSWSYMGTEWTLTETVANASYISYHDLPKTYDYPSYVTKNDAIIVNIAAELKSDAETRGYNNAQFILSFVQNVPYGTDENTTGLSNYPRYPVETLVDHIGDCKDHSFLYVSLMESQPVNVSMVLLQLMPSNGGVGHMAAGIWASGYTGTYFQYDGRDYFYCETTSPGWRIGQMPPQVEGYDVTVLWV